MRKLIAIAIFAVPMIFLYAQQSVAVCTEAPEDVWTCTTDPPNPDLDGVQDTNNTPKTVNVLEGAGIDTVDSGNIAIETAAEADEVTVEEGDLVSESETISTVQGDDEVKIMKSTVRSTDNTCIDTSDDDDLIEIIDSLVECSTTGIDGGGDDDTMLVEDSTIASLNGGNPVRGSGGNDTATIRNSLLRSTDTAVSMSSGDDRVNLGTNARLNGILDCGSGIDTLAFQMEVPEDALGFFGSRIAALVPGDVQSIEIDGLVYDLEDCEIFLNELVGVPNVRPIPTLSEWGLIALAGAMGVSGVFFVLRRRSVSVQ